MKPVRFLVGPGRPVFLVAEVGVNHQGDVRMAKKLVDAAAECGADAVKFQTFRAETLCTRGANKAPYQGRGSQFDMLKSLELTAAEHRQLRDHCARRGILYLTSPFDDGSLAEAVALGVPALKVPSGEITNFPFLRRFAAARLPIILSTGMSDMREVEDALRVLRAAGARRIVALHCVSSYPAPPAECNLRAIPAMTRKLEVPVGLSDHTMGIHVAVAAAAFGACLIEKHFTLDRALPGPDHKASLEPLELLNLVRSVRDVEAALGDGRKRPMPSELENRRVVRRSVVAAADLPAGAVLRADDLALKRPGTGMPPRDLSRLVGRRLRRAVRADEPLRWSHVRSG